MSNLMSGVDQRTKLAGENRLELLVFNLGTDQLFGLNVFKVREIVEKPKITPMPRSAAEFVGMANIRGMIIGVIDLETSIRMNNAVDIPNRLNPELIIITEFNRTTQGFIVSHVEDIINIEWTDVQLPPGGLDCDYITGIVEYDNQLIQILDVEHILAQLNPGDQKPSEHIVSEAEMIKGKRVLVADDSVTARNQVTKVLDHIQLKYVAVNDGQQAYDQLLKSVDDGTPFDLVLSDIEMPEMDGYTLTTKIRENADLQHLPVILHSSLSGGFNESMIKKVKADKLVSKFAPDDLITAIIEILNK